MERFRRFFDSPGSVFAALAALLGLGVLVAGAWTSLWFWAFTLAAAIPGWLACRWLYGPAFASRITALGHALILGLVAVTGLAACAAALGASAMTTGLVLAAAAASGGLFWALGRFSEGPALRGPALETLPQYAVFGLGLLLLFCVIALPFWNVGRLVEAAGYVYAPYFNRDFLRNLAFGAALAHGPLPPMNPFYAGETLHYYWFQAAFPALVYQASGRTTSLEGLFLLSTLVIDVAFVFVLIHLARRYVVSQAGLVMVVLLATVAESYQAPLKALLSLYPTHWALDSTWIGAIALPPLGYLYQSYLYLPQHLAALAALLVAIPLLDEPTAPHPIRRAMAGGSLLALASGFSFFVIAFGFLWAGSSLALHALRGARAALREGAAHRWNARLRNSCVMGLIVALAGVASLIMLRQLDMLLPGSGATGWSLNVEVRQLAAPLRLFFMLGPMLILGAWGALALRWDRDLAERSLGMVWLFVAALGMVLFVVPLNIQAWEVPQKLGAVLRIPLLVFSGVCIDRLLSSLSDIESAARRPSRRWSAAWLLCASAVPNLLAFHYVHWNVNDSNLLTYVSPAERAAAEWMRTNLPVDAVVQSWPEGQRSARPYFRVNNEDNYSLAPVFGERQTAVGDPLFTRYFVPEARIGEVDARAGEIAAVFAAPERADVLGVLRKYGIGYLYWGLSETSCCAANVGWFMDSPLFERAYEQDGVLIFALTKKD